MIFLSLFADLLIPLLFSDPIRPYLPIFAVVIGVSFLIDLVVLSYVIKRWRRNRG